MVLCEWLVKEIHGIQANVRQYRLNGDKDYHDPKEQWTTFCPSLPGQSVNILEVPIQADEPQLPGPNGSTTSIDSFVFTLDPRDKYVPIPVRRAATTSVLQQRNAHLVGGEGEDVAGSTLYLPKGEESSENVTPNHGEPSSHKKRSIKSVFGRLRQTRSVGSNLKVDSTWKAGNSWPRKIFSSAAKSRKGGMDELIPEVPKIPASFLAMAPYKGHPESDQVVNLLSEQIKKVKISSQRPSKSEKPKDNLQVPLPLLNQIRSVPSLPRAKASKANIRPISSRGYRASRVSSFVPSPKVDQVTANYSHVAVPLSDSIPTSSINDVQSETDHEPMQAEKNIREVEYSDDPNNFVSPQGRQNLVRQNNECNAYSYSESSCLSYATSDMFSPCLASNTTTSGRISPVHLSQPDTPHLDGYDKDDIAWQRGSYSEPDQLHKNIPYIIKEEDYNALPPPAPSCPPPPPLAAGQLAINAGTHPSLGGFQGYSLPTPEQASMLTIKEQPGLPFKPTLNHCTGTQQLVQSWDDGVEMRMSSLVDDLGYLGELIE